MLLFLSWKCIIFKYRCGRLSQNLIILKFTLHLLNVIFALKKPQKPLGSATATMLQYSSNYKISCRIKMKSISLIFFTFLFRWLFLPLTHCDHGKKQDWGSIPVWSNIDNFLILYHTCNRCRWKIRLWSLSSHISGCMYVALILQNLFQSHTM